MASRVLSHSFASPALAAGVPPFTNLSSTRCDAPRIKSMLSAFIVGPDRRVRLVKAGAAHDGRSRAAVILAVLESRQGGPPEGSLDAHRCE